jgi:hypothetical protein
MKIKPKLKPKLNIKDPIKGIARSIIGVKLEDNIDDVKIVGEIDGNILGGINNTPVEVNASIKITKRF